MNFAETSNGSTSTLNNFNSIQGEKNMSNQGKEAPSNSLDKLMPKIIFTAGGRGGSGKTALAMCLAGWYDHHEIPVRLIDADSENKAKGSFHDFYGDRAPKIDISVPEGLDKLVNSITDDVPIVLCDQGAGSGRVTFEWFNLAHKQLAKLGYKFTAIGLVTDSPTSVQSVLDWANVLQNRVQYLIVKNHINRDVRFEYWDESVEVQRFIDRYSPSVIEMPYLVPVLENAIRNWNVPLANVAARKTDVPELQELMMVIRAGGHLDNMYEQFDKVREVLLP